MARVIVWNKILKMKHKFILFCLLLIIIDLIIKVYIHQNFEYYAIIYNWHNLITIGYVPSMYIPRFSVLENIILIGVAIIRTTIQLLIIFLFIRMILKQEKVRKLYRYAITLISFGAMGSFIDKIIFMKGDFHYSKLNYFTTGDGSGLFWDISDILVALGWILFFTDLFLRKIGARQNSR